MMFIDMKSIIYISNKIFIANPAIKILTLVNYYFYISIKAIYNRFDYILYSWYICRINYNIIIKVYIFEL